jgi:predicted DsbA family dithiol-disulfide isomerase
MFARMPSIDIDLISDVVCPWCLIGTRNLDLALEGLPDVKATVRFRPFPGGS